MSVDGLEEHIQSWRGSLTASMAFTQADLFELEDHLRSRASSLMEKGQDVDSAFAEAAAELGQPEELIPRFREQNKHVLLLELLILAGWGFVALVSSMLLFDYLVKLVAIFSAILTNSIPVTNALLIVTAAGYLGGILLILVAAVRWNSLSRLKQFVVEEPARLSVMPLWLLLLCSEFFLAVFLSSPILGWMIRWGKFPFGWADGLCATDIAYPGFSVGHLAKLTFFLHSHPVLLEGNTISRATVYANIQSNPVSLIFIVAGLVIALVILWKKGISLESLRRTFFFAGINLFMGLALLGEALFGRLTIGTAQCVAMLVALLFILIPLLSRSCLEKKRFIAS